MPTYEATEIPSLSFGEISEMKIKRERFPYLSKPYQLTKEIYRNKTLIYLGQDVIQMFLAHTF
jgi:hypothetical protein